MAGGNVTRCCTVPGCGRQRQSRRYCGPHEYRWQRYGDPLHSILLPLPATCEVPECGKKVFSRWNKQGAALCAAHYARMQRRGTLCTVKDKTHYVECQQCGNATAGGFKFCGELCRTRWSRAKLRVDDPDRFRARFVDQTHRRKARLLGAFVEKVDPLVVLERDRWRCHLCGGRISKKARYPDPMFGSMDHVLPLAAGGAHSYANVKAAHLCCNRSKGAKPLGQLGLALA